MGADAPKLSRITSEIFGLAFPTDDANYSLQNLLSHWIVRTCTCQQQFAKQTRKMVCVCGGGGGGGGGGGLKPPLRHSSQAHLSLKIRNLFARSFFIPYCVRRPPFIREEVDPLFVESG